MNFPTLRKRLTPDYYEEPWRVTIPVHSLGAPMFDQETLVVLRRSDETVGMIVPTWCYDPETGTIPATAVGERDGAVLFIFPQTQLGQHTFAIPKDEVEAWLKQENVDLNGPIRNIW